MRRSHKVCGIYTITNIIDNKIYVGYSDSILDRFDSHKSYLRSFNHGNIHLQNAWNKYGEKNFLFEILEECEKDFLCSQENYWCNLLNTHNQDFGYNLALTGPNNIHLRHSIQSRQKMSISQKIRTSRDYKKVVQKDLSGKIIHIHSNIREALNHLGKSSNLALRNALHSGKPSYNHLWEFKK